MTGSSSHSTASETTPSSPWADDWSHVAPNLAGLRTSIAAVAERAGRDPAAIELVAVTKTFPVAAIRAALDAGQSLFGENRVQEALPKIDELAKIEEPAGSGARFHLVGHLQRNKAKFASAFACVQSVDSVRLAEALDARVEAPFPVLLEVNVAGEESKQGFDPQEFPETLSQIQTLAQLQVQGLMTVAPLVADAEEVRPVFRELRVLRERLGLERLSMGMSGDYEVAIEEGATMLRIGRAIFGDRPVGSPNGSRAEQAR